MACTKLARVLVIDDESEIVTFIVELLVRRGYEATGLSDARAALTAFQEFQPEICILDFKMPHVLGSEILDAVKQLNSTTEVIFLTAEHETSLAVDLMKRGAIDFLLKPVELTQLSLAVDRALDHHRLVKENEAYRLHLEKLVAEKTKALNDALSSITAVHSATLQALSLALDFRDQSTSGHSARVAGLTAGAAKFMGVAGAALVQIEHGALLHDIGKLKIPDRVLWKPSRLDDDEWKVMKCHAQYGYDFLSNLEWLRDAAELVLSHHEKFDGSGYPRGLSGDTIPLGARVFTIVDAVDAMIYQRPYNKPVNFNEAAAEVRRCAGVQFDPHLVEPTLNYLGRQLPGHLL